jgi:tripartite ATP-independent transporter DctP family solute receptor
MKKTFSLMFVVLLGFSFFQLNAAEHKLVFTSVSVPNDAHTGAMMVFERELERLSEGKIDVEVYHSGQLFTQNGEQAAVRRKNGGTDLVYSGPNWLAEYVPYMSMFAAAYMFKDYNHMSETFNGPMGKDIFDDIAKKVGIRPLGAFYLGTRELNLRDIGRVVKTPADLKGVKLRMPGSPTWLFMGKALGANPTPMAFTEVYMGLKTGAIDGQDNPLPTDKNAKFYEVTKYIILTDHFINPVFPTINEAKWQSLGTNLQAKVYEAVEKARVYCDSQNLNQEALLVEFFKNEGMSVIVPDKQAFMNHVQKQYLENKDLASNWDMEMFRKLQESAE